MPLVSFAVPFSKPNPTVVPADTRAVPAATYRQREADAGDPGGITAVDIDPADIRPLGSYEDGAEVYVESDDPNDVLDDTDDDTAAATRLWWRAVLVEK